MSVDRALSGGTSAPQFRFDGPEESPRGPQFLSRPSKPEPEKEIHSMQQFMSYVMRGEIAELMSLCKEGKINQKILDEEVKLSAAQMLIMMNKASEVYKLLAYTDTLTGVPNRRYFEEALENKYEALRSGRRQSERPFGLIVLDIDFFKRFNDDHGHQAGDEVLKLVATTIHDSLRTKPGGSDIVARFGGEEFVIIIDNVSSDEQMQAVLLELNKLKFPNDYRELTISVGGVICSAEMCTAHSKDELFEVADQGVYAVKEGGRNGVSFPSMDGTKRYSLHGGKNEFTTEDIS